MVKKIMILATGFIVAILTIATLRSMRSCNTGECRETKSALAAETGLGHQDAPLTEEDALECCHAFEEIGNAYSNLQFEAMQAIFCNISNNVARLGKDRLDRAIQMLKTSFREQFWLPDVKACRFSTVSEFERFIRANVAAENIIGCSMLANDIFDSRIREYDMVVFRGISDFLKEFKDRNDDAFAVEAQSLLDEWKKHLASGQSVTRMQLKQELKWCLKLPRWRAEDMGMKSENDWKAYMRDCALKYHRQCYGVVPDWIDEEFPSPQKNEEGLE